MPDTTTLVIFGASGDLTHRKLIPALVRLQDKGRLPEDFRVLGVGRTPFSDDEFRQSIRESIASQGPIQGDWPQFTARLGCIPRRGHTGHSCFLC